MIPQEPQFGWSRRLAGLATIGVGGALLCVSLFGMKAMAATSQPSDAGQAVSEPTNPQPPIPRPRDPDIAVKEEYDAAVQAGTIAALELFIARHPGHALAADAESDLLRLKATRSP